MISPRAARHGYPWQDTLTHEVTHLALTRASRDEAPLWLQEGIAKREEIRWREERPFDDQRNPHAIAREALLNGTSVGIDRIGPSIAMLPTPQAAAISYAEVESFMDFWIGKLGRAAFALLLTDMKGLGTRDADAAMLSVTGYPLEYWIASWQEHLRGLPEPPLPEEPKLAQSRLPAAQGVRLGDLLYARGQAELLPRYYDDALLTSPDKAAVRFRAAAAQVESGNPEGAAERLGDLASVSSLYGSWLGLHGRLLLEAQKQNDAERMFELAISVDPLGEVAACEGVSRRTVPAAAPGGAPPPPRSLPTEPNRRGLCEAARATARD
jgi:tetratricopeptide (TPR) repeat protein